MYFRKRGDASTAPVSHSQQPGPTRTNQSSLILGARAMFSRKSATKELDFNEEARALWARLNLDPGAVNGNQWNPVDPIWKHPQTGGVIYVGNQTAAQDLRLLRYSIYKIMSVIKSCHVGRIDHITLPLLSTVHTDRESVSIMHSACHEYKLTS